MIKLVAGIIQTGVFADFGYYYYKRYSMLDGSAKLTGNTIQLPV